MIFQMVAKKVFGAGYERLKRTVPVWAIIFWGLKISGFKLEIAPFILYFMAGAFTAGVMWQALSSQDNAANMMNLFMLPFRGKELIFAYVSALGLYTLSTKTLGLLCVMWAVSDQSIAEVAGSLLCAVSAVWISAFVYAWKHGSQTGRIRMDAYAFYSHTGLDGLFRVKLLHPSRRSFGAIKFYVREKPVCGMVCRYLLRYVATHGNYILNTLIMWGLACILPAFLDKMGGSFAVPVGLVIVSINTPVHILLSCDPALEQAVRFLPGQRAAFAIPYGIFLFLCHIVPEGIFLCSWEILSGGVPEVAVWCAVGLAALGAAGSVLLEWFFPVRGWKIESDLWHHPRKYIVPGALLLVAAALGGLMG